MQKLKKFIRSHSFLYCSYKKVFHVYKYFFAKNSYPIKITKKYLKEQYCENFNFQTVPKLKKTNKKIAVHLHLFYIDLLEEFCRYLSNIPFYFDIFISCREGSDKAMIKNRVSKLKYVKHIIIKETQNKGRDIAPLYIVFAKDILRYDYFLQIHTKKSLHFKNGRPDWRNYCLSAILGNKDTVKRIFSTFSNDSKVGLFMPKKFKTIRECFYCWSENKEIGIKFLKKMRIKFNDESFDFPAGSFFWAKIDAVRPLLEYNMKYSDFQDESGQVDGTLAHALERIIAFIVESQGYLQAGYNPEDNSLIIKDIKRI
ncbi:MAG TPA: rhamnan synthesis F family protein [Spirochaetota bacterium]|nr:rhamnan synthesis F family protein [Spirochaetota bacterium]